MNTGIPPKKKAAKAAHSRFNPLQEYRRRHTQITATKKRDGSREVAKMKFRGRARDPLPAEKLSCTSPNPGSLRVCMCAIAAVVSTPLQGYDFRGTGYPGASLRSTPGYPRLAFQGNHMFTAAHSPAPRHPASSRSRLQWRAGRAAARLAPCQEQGGLD